MNIPQSTIEKPLTAIDYLARLQDCLTLDGVSEYASAVPLHIPQRNERFAKAVASRLAAIKASR